MLPLVGSSTERLRVVSIRRFGHANKTSSFAMVDFIVEKVVERNPNLWHIAVVGHSAGGQFVNRYAAGTAIPGWALNRVQQKQDPDTGQFVQRGVTMSFGVSSAGSFLYFDHDRPKYTWEQRQLLLALFGADPIQQSCPTYNDYKYGLDGLNSYMNNSTESELKFRAISRHVRYFVGEKDDKLDTGCQVTVQGENHVVRMENYEAHLEHICQSLGPMCDVFNFRSARRFTVVPGVGHDSKLLFGSAVGRSILFRDE